MVRLGNLKPGNEVLIRGTVDSSRKETVWGEWPFLAVLTDDVWEERVVLKIGTKEYTVVASDLMLAIQRCSR